MFFRTRRKVRPTAYLISCAQPVQPEGAREQVASSSVQRRRIVRARARILMCLVAFVFTFGALGVRLAYVSFGDVAPARAFAAAGRDGGPRPELVDRNGAILATDIPMVALEIAGRDVWDADETANAVKSVLADIDAPALAEKLRAGRYVEVASDLTPFERRAIFSLGQPGVRFATRNKRFYPQGDLGAHVVGHSEAGKGGVMGLERYITAEMAKATADAPVRAAIDVRVQQALEQELQATMTQFKALAAWGAVMDVETGEVIALASLPDFDPNAPGAAPPDARRNRATYDRYELGSAFKAFVGASALEAGLAREDTTYDARKPFKVADRTITDFHGENRILTFSEVIQHSSNIGAARMAGDLGVARQKKYLDELGLLDALPIELAENRSPQPPDKWGPVEAATVSYGHGISVTPLHLLAAFSAVVNGGEYHTPRFLAVDGDASDERASNMVFSEETSAIMRRVLRRVVIDGTASKAEAQGYFPIGKSATADKPSAGGYNRNARIASFIGAAPGYAPRYAILISFDNPQPGEGTYGYATAGWNAAPTFSRFVNRAAPLLGLTPVNEAVALSAFMGAAPYREARADLEPSAP
ncbi:MAG: penicillin-binding protein 2 [Pseudomonadota bacterium]